MIEADLATRGMGGKVKNAGRLPALRGCGWLHAFYSFNPRFTIY